MSKLSQSKPIPSKLKPTTNLRFSFGLKYHIGCLQRTNKAFKYCASWLPYVNWTFLNHYDLRLISMEWLLLSSYQCNFWTMLGSCLPKFFTSIPLIVYLINFQSNRGIYSANIPSSNVNIITFEPDFTHCLLQNPMNTFRQSPSFIWSKFGKCIRCHHSTSGDE